MNSGRQLFSVSRNVLHQNVIRRNKGGSGEEIRKGLEKITSLEAPNKDGIRVARGILGIVMGYLVLRTAWLNYHVFPLTEDPDDG